MDRFQRGGAVFSAVRWSRHGDHPSVRPASKSDVPWSSDPGPYGWLDDQGCGHVVIPGDYIVTDESGCLSVVDEKTFRKVFAPSDNATP